MPPTDFCNCVYDVRTRTQTLSFLAGTEAKTSFLFLRVIAFSLAGAVTRGEPRCVRWIEPRCRFLLVIPGLPDLDARPTAPPTTRFFRACRSVVTIDAHVPKDRVKDPSSGIVRGVFYAPSRTVHAFGYRMLTRFPSSASFEHPLSPVRAPTREESHADDDGPTEAYVPPAPREGHRHPVSRDAFHRDDRALCPTDYSAARYTPTSRSRRPTGFPHCWGQRCFSGIASVTGRSPADP